MSSIRNDAQHALTLDINPGKNKTWSVSKNFDQSGIKETKNSSLKEIGLDILILWRLTKKEKNIMKNINSSQKQERNLNGQYFTLEKEDR